MLQIISDVFIMENLRVLNEGKNGGPMVIEGTFQRADEENNNKRIYRKTLLEREMKKLSTAISERRLLGELDHPQHDSVKLGNVSHLITGLRMEGKEVIGKAEILNTPSGKVAQALIEGGVKVGISSRGLGTLSEDENGKRYVNEDFQLVTWDLVADPSTRGAFPGLTESTEIAQIIEDVLPEAQKLQNFATILRKKLDDGMGANKLQLAKYGDGKRTSSKEPVKSPQLKYKEKARKKRMGAKEAVELIKAKLAEAGLSKLARVQKAIAKKPAKAPVSKIISTSAQAKHKGKSSIHRQYKDKDGKVLEAIRTKLHLTSPYDHHLTKPDIAPTKQKVKTEEFVSVLRKKLDEFDPNRSYTKGPKGGKPKLRVGIETDKEKAAHKVAASSRRLVSQKPKHTKHATKKHYTRAGNRAVGGGDSLSK